MRRILRNQAGNVLAITAAATIPMLGVIGGAVDVSRLYLTRSRVQAACDSAVLAGRKAMSTATYTDTAKARARSMFNVNYQEADYSATGTTFVTSADAAGKVSGTAKTTVPMLIMGIFGSGPSEIEVTCSADIQVPNIDIVLVLDVTGSMDQQICTGSYWNQTCKKKLDSLKEAAKNFYTTLDAALAGNTQSRIRYGFVPYSQLVNGKDLFKVNPDATKGELPLTHLADSMEVQSRVANFNTPVTQWVEDPNSTPASYTQVYGASNSLQPYQQTNSSGATNISSSNCDSYSSNTTFWGGSALSPSGSTLYKPENSNTWQTNQPSNGNSFTMMTFSRVGFSGNAWNAGQCTRRVMQTRYIKRTAHKFTNWTYKPVNLNVSQYKSGSSISYVSGVDSNYTVDSTTPVSLDPVQLRMLPNQSGLTSASTPVWDGCIEERATVSATSFAPIPTNAYDLNFLSGGTSDMLRWRPTLRGLTYDRGQIPAATPSNSSYSLVSNNNYLCPTVSMRNLNEMTWTQYKTYIESLEADGNTYLDVGMIWGLRLITPQGMFANRNLTGLNGGQISRHLIFLTDGEPVSAGSSYSAYGVENMAGRITGGSSNPSAATRHALRFQALCDAHRNGISIWAIAFGTSVTGNLTACADPGRAMQANNTAELNSAFQRIAQEVADLRLVQ